MHLVTFLYAMGAKDRISETIVTAPPHGPRTFERVTLHAQSIYWWCIKRDYETVELVSTLQILSMIVVLILVYCKPHKGQWDNLIPRPYFLPVASQARLPPL